MKIHAPIEAIISVTGLDLLFIKGEKTRRCATMAIKAPTRKEAGTARIGDNLTLKPAVIRIEAYAPRVM